MKTVKNIGYRNAHGAYFEKDAESEEGFYHFCDEYRREAVPEIWKHDINTWLFIRDEQGKPVKDFNINYCPLCGKKLD